MEAYFGGKLLYQEIDYEKRIRQRRLAYAKNNVQ